MKSIIKNTVSIKILIVKISISLLLSYLSTYRLILWDHEFMYVTGSILLIFCLFLFFYLGNKLILTFYYLLDYVTAKFRINGRIDIIKKGYDFIFLPCLLLGLASAYLSMKAINLNYIDLYSNNYTIDYRGMALNLSAKILPVSTILAFSLSFIFLYIFLYKFNKFKLRLFISILLTLILTIVSVFLITKMISYIYLFIVIILDLLINKFQVG